jgi:hypothetical protein
LPWLRGLILFPAQILGAVCAAAVVDVMFPPSISMVNTILAPGISIAQGLFIEMFLTCLLMITVLMLAAEKSKDTFLAPVGIGLALFVAELAGTISMILCTLSRHYTDRILQESTIQEDLSIQPEVLAHVLPREHSLVIITSTGLGPVLELL